MNTLGTLFEIREFCVHDGPGVRTTLFFKGCPLRCRWCHNPEGLSFQSEIMVNSRKCLECGNCRKVCSSPDHCVACGVCADLCPAGKRRLVGFRISAEETAKKVLRFSSVFRQSGGGVTFSGGEPLAQPDFLLETAERLVSIHRAVETSGFASSGIYKAMLQKIDFVFQDLKHPDSNRHRELTGQPNDQILDNLELLKVSGKPYIIRIPVIPGLNDDEETIRHFIQIISVSASLKAVQLLPFNQAAGAKYTSIGRIFNIVLPEHPRPLAECARQFRQANLPVEIL